ncbi:MAG: DUF3137 domain-containing protein [Mangrovibacterium sp.]
MDSTSRLAEIYQTQLAPALLALEAERKTVVKRILLSTAILLLGVLFFIVGRGATYAIVAGVVIVIGAIISYAFASERYNLYKQAFKNNIVPKVVASIDPSWCYSPQSHISQAEYYQSRLFEKRCDRFKGDDLITGMIGKTDFRLSELHTEYRTVTVDNKGRRSEQWHTIFKGLFVHADFNKEIKDQTFVLPDTAERLLGKWGQKLQSFDPRGQLVKLENPEFETYFVVYASNQTEARYILTPIVMEALVTMRKQFNTEIAISFVGTRVYFAFSFSQDLFEPRLFSSGVRFTDIEQMQYQFNMITVIINELNLNTRIWTKT